MKAPVFTGSSAAIVTPFRNTAVDYKSLGALIDFQINGGTSAITVCGTTGESATLTHEEQMNVIEYTVKKTGGRVPVIAGTGSNDTQKALMLSLEAESLGASALLIVTPYYNKATQNGIIRHYTYIADRVRIPVIIYNVPSRTGVSCSVETYKTLSQHPRICGVKEASGDIAHAAALRAACGDALHLWSGNDHDIVAMMALGAQGVISVAANIIPQIISRMTGACLNGNFAEGAALQFKYLPLISSLFCEVNPIPVKAAMNLLGMCSDEVRLPLSPINDVHLELIKYELKNAGLARK